MKRPEVAAKVSATIKRKWTAFFSSQLKKNWKEGIVQFNPNARIGICPNKAERKLQMILQEHLPNFIFTGNGTFWIGPCTSGMRRNPDFICKREKKVILLHGEYWHKSRAVEKERKDYRDQGWLPLIIWFKELQTKNRIALLAKLTSFGAASFPSAS